MNNVWKIVAGTEPDYPIAVYPVCIVGQKSWYVTCWYDTPPSPQYCLCLQSGVEMPGLLLHFRDEGNRGCSTK